MKVVLTVLFSVIIISVSAIDLDLNSSKTFFTINGDFQITSNSMTKMKQHEYTKLEVTDCINSGNAGEAELPVFSKLVTLPATGNFIISSVKYDFTEMPLDKDVLPVGLEDEININDSYYSQNKWFPQEIIIIGNPNIMRSHRFVQVTVAAVQYNPVQKKIRILNDVDINFTLDESVIENPLTKIKPSRVFDNIAKQKIVGAEDSGINNSGQYLFIAPDNVATNLQPLLREKEKLGYKTKLATLSETGSSEQQIKDYLQNAYDNWQNPPEYVVLVGDVTGTIQLPAFYVEGYLHPWAVTDHSYTLLNGNDYFPDILIGRLSVQSEFELTTIINKIINYEMNPYTDYDWTRRALMVSYVQDYWIGFFSPRETVMEVREKLIEFEFAAVDTFISPWQSGTNNLVNMISSGYTFVNYRGCGAPGYWAGPYGSMLDVSNIAQLTNGSMLPMVTSMTCGGGNFAYNGMSSVFGETWLNAGTPSFPKGAIGFIGPSEHDTKTWFNNANDMGIYHGVTQENLFRCGEMLLRGKMELYNNYPNNHAWGNALNSDQFYFYVYNLLGDPGLQVWTDVPQEVDFEYPTEITSADNFMNFNITTNLLDLGNFTIAITNEDSLITKGVTNIEGSVNIPLSLPAGNYSVTASKYGFIPKTETFEVLEADIIAVTEFIINEPIAGDLIEIDATLQNFNIASAENILLTLSSDSEFVEIVNGSSNITALLSGQSQTENFQIQLSSLWNEGRQVELFLEIESTVGISSFILVLELISPEFNIADFIVDNNEGCLMQNEINSVDIEILNSGSQDASELSINIESMNNNCLIESAESTYLAISAGTTGINTVPFEISCLEVVSGELALIRIQVIEDENVVQQFEYSIPIGEISQESPTFCDYGYYAVESEDVGYFDVPEYDWIELAPSNGGAGTLVDPTHATSDGFMAIMDLPFEFIYFGKQYNTISICSNGYVSMGETENLFARNRTIPSGVGSSAMIAPFWDDLTNGQVYTQYFPNEHYFVVQWNNMRNVYSNAYETFELILFDPEFNSGETGDGDIKFQYQEVHNIDQNDNYATVGIENDPQTEGILMTFANIYNPTAHTLQDGSAIVFTTKTEYLVLNDENTLPESGTTMSQNYPNPFNPSTSINYSISEDQLVKINIYNIRGEFVKSLVNEVQSAGDHSVEWQGQDVNNKHVSSGIYFYNMIKDNKTVATHKCLLLK
jgi:Peptidase family C25/Propeptide_C25/FlgD Ig-like domain